MNKKILALILLTSLTSGLSAAGPGAGSDDNAVQKHSFATLVGAVGGAGITMVVSPYSSGSEVFVNAFKGAVVANSVVAVDRMTGEPKWLPAGVKKPVAVVGGLIVYKFWTK